MKNMFQVFFYMNMYKNTILYKLIYWILTINYKNNKFRLENTFHNACIMKSVFESKFIIFIISSKFFRVFKMKIENFIWKKGDWFILENLLHWLLKG